MKVALIDRRIDYETFIAGLKSDVVSIYIELDDTYESLLEKIRGLDESIENVVIAQHLNPIGIAIGSEKIAVYNDVSTYADLKQFLVELKALGATTVDFLACLLYAQPGVPEIFAQIEAETGIDLRASTDDTGNVTEGGNWVLESDMADIQGLYFTEEIEKFKELFVAVLISNGTSANIVYGNSNYCFTEFIITATELSGAGFSANSTINSMTFTINDITISIPDSAANIAEFAIWMQHTTSLALTTGLALIRQYSSSSYATTRVYNSTTDKMVMGNNKYNLSTPFVWNGTNNIYVSVSSNRLVALAVTSDASTYNTINASRRFNSTTARTYSSFLAGTTSLTTSIYRPAVALNDNEVLSFPLSGSISITSGSSPLQLNTSLTLSATALNGTGEGPTYQWKLNGSNIVNATSSTYTITNTSLSSNNTTYEYSCTITKGTETITTNTISVLIKGYDVPCFVSGTMILTPTGEKPIESLRTGDIVLTADGRKVPAKIYSTHIPVTTEINAPYLIPANAFRANYPPQDITLSPKHAIQSAKNVWQIPQFAAEIYTAIKKTNIGGHATYYHIELPNYFTDNIVANGSVCESLGSKAQKNLPKGQSLYTFRKKAGGFIRNAPQNDSKVKKSI